VDARSKSSHFQRLRLRRATARPLRVPVPWLRCPEIRRGWRLSHRLALIKVQGLFGTLPRHPQKCGLGSSIFPDPAKGIDSHTFAIEDTVKVPVELAAGEYVPKLCVSAKQGLRAGVPNFVSEIVSHFNQPWCLTSCFSFLYCADELDLAVLCFCEKTPQL
jgi:hypothetical protein